MPLAAPVTMATRSPLIDRDSFVRRVGPVILVPWQVVRPVVTPSEMAAIDAEAEDPVEVLIERAGTAVARSAEAMLGGVYGRRVAVIAGHGNNGRDGLLAGERLRARGASVTVYDARVRPDRLPPTDLVIDAAYGTGFHGDWVAPEVDTAAVLAVDIPSGIDGLTGEASTRVLRADTTVTFAALKPGLVIGEGPDYAGDVEVVDIGLDVARARVFVVEGSDVAKWWRPRSRTAHKWSTAVRVVAGGPGMQGAGFLAAAAAQRTGAGMVQLVSPVPQPHAPVEAVTAPLPPYDWAQEALRELHRFHGMVLGPGLGRRDQTGVAIREVARRADVPLVIDGDGLYALSVGLDPATAIVQQRSQPTVLTPHDGEFALLTGPPAGARSHHGCPPARPRSCARSSSSRDRPRSWRRHRAPSGLSTTPTSGWPQREVATSSPG